MGANDIEAAFILRDDVSKTLKSIDKNVSNASRTMGDNAERTGKSFAKWNAAFKIAEAGLRALGRAISRDTELQQQLSTINEGFWSSVVVGLKTVSEITGAASAVGWLSSQMGVAQLDQQLISVYDQLQKINEMMGRSRVPFAPGTDNTPGAVGSSFDVFGKQKEALEQQKRILDLAKEYSDPEGNFGMNAAAALQYADAIVKQADAQEKMNGELERRNAALEKVRAFQGGTSPNDIASAFGVSDKDTDSFRSLVGSVRAYVDELGKANTENEKMLAFKIKLWEAGVRDKDVIDAYTEAFKKGSKAADEWGDKATKALGSFDDMVKNSQSDFEEYIKREEEKQKKLAEEFDFSAGFNAAAKDMESNFLHLGNIAKRFATETHATISNDLFAALKGDEISFATFTTHILDSMLRQVTDATAAGFLGLFAGGGKSGGGLPSFLSSLFNNNSGSSTGDIPQRGEGGYFNRPELAIIGDKPETIIPDSKMPAFLRQARGGGDTIVNNFNISTSDPMSFDAYLRANGGRAIRDHVESAIRSRSRIRGLVN